jgi:hypothetical protein
MEWAKDRAGWRSLLFNGKQKCLATWEKKRAAISAKSKSKRRTAVRLRANLRTESDEQEGRQDDEGGEEDNSTSSRPAPAPNPPRSKARKIVHSGEIFQKLEDTLAVDPWRVATRRGRHERRREDFSERKNRETFLPSKEL